MEQNSFSLITILKEIKLVNLLFLYDHALNLHF